MAGDFQFFLEIVVDGLKDDFYVPTRITTS
jgi:hypothetical protein